MGVNNNKNQIFNYNTTLNNTHTKQNYKQKKNKIIIYKYKY